MVHFTYAKRKQLEIDVVCRSGFWWIKVKSMNADAIEAIAEGRGAPKDKSVIDLGEEMIEASLEYEQHHQHPKCVIRFYNGVTDGIRSELEDQGVLVQDVKSYNVLDTEPWEIPYGEIVNLDITTLICIVSDLTNGGCDFDFEESVLAFQAKEERVSPILPEIESLMKNRTVIITKSALNAFHGILDLLAGEKEKERAEKLLEKCKIIEDDPSERMMNITKKLENKHKNVFGTGDKVNAVTLTGNHRIVHSIKTAGVPIRVYMHGARALTERKKQEQQDGKKHCKSEQNQ